MSIILIVDDDKNFLLSLVEGLKAHDQEFEIRTATNGKIAAQIISDEYVDLVITDLKMPVMDGFELLAYMSSHFPRIPVIVMTAYGTPVIENSVSHLGAIRYLEKPLDFDLLVENIYKSVEQHDNSYIPGISLISFLKLVQMEKKTCILTIRNQEHEGEMFFKKGVLIDAVTPENNGETAAMEILGWEQVEMQIRSKSFSMEKNILNDLDFLITVFESRRPSRRSAGVDEPSSSDSYDNTLDDIFDVGGTAKTAFSGITQENTSDPSERENILLEKVPVSAGKKEQEAPLNEPIIGNEVTENDFLPETGIGEFTSTPPPENSALAETGEEEGGSEAETAVDTNNKESQNNLLSAADVRQEQKTNFFEGKENVMNVKKMNEAVDTLKETAGAGLLACDVFMTRDGQSLVGYNSNPAYCAMSNQITQYMKETLQEAGFPPLGSTYMIDLNEDKMVISMVMGDYQWGILIDTKKCSLGMLLNVALPRAKAVFEAALSN